MLNENGAKNIHHQNLLFSDGQHLTDKKDAHCTAQTESFITARAISHLIPRLMCVRQDAQGFGFENKGTEALSFRQVYGCFFRLPTSQRIKGCLWK